MHDEVDFSDADVEELAVSGNVADNLASERRDRYLEGLEGSERDDFEAFDDASNESSTQVGDECVHFRKLWHPPSLLLPTDVRPEASGRAKMTIDGD
jgi:hypothetical protein